MNARGTKSLPDSEELFDYILSHGTPPDAVLRHLAEVTAAIGPQARMQIDAEQGSFLTWLTRTLGVRRAVEVGTFTGYSSICIARGLAPGGRLLCLDVSDEWTRIAREHWKQADLEDRIELLLGPALESLAALPDDEEIDLVFIDADKPNYHAYLEAVFPRLREGGVILVDNVLWSGAVVDPSDQEESTVAIRDFNDRVARDERFDRTMLGRFDGLTLLRKREATDH